MSVVIFGGEIKLKVFLSVGVSGDSLSSPWLRLGLGSQELRWPSIQKTNAVISVPLLCGHLIMQIFARSLPLALSYGKEIKTLKLRCMLCQCTSNARLLVFVPVKFF
jgi:hypothetical protein